MQEEIFGLVDLAVEGDKEALEKLIGTVQDMVYNLSLRMLGSPQDAEDASQEIYIRIITGLSSFRKESSFSTWCYRIAINHLLNYKKSFFAKQPLSFDFYGSDIEAGYLESNPAITEGIDETILTEELKMSCTNVMLQCFDPESRLIYVLGIMFKIDSKICGEILDISPEAYRKRLSRIRKKMVEFLKQYCGLASSDKCSCEKRITYAITNHRLMPDKLEYHHLEKTKTDDVAAEYKEAMETMDELSLIFAELPKYRSPKTVVKFVADLLDTDQMRMIQHTKKEAFQI